MDMCQMDMIHCLHAAFMNFRIIYYEIKDFSVGEIVMQYHSILFSWVQG